MNSYLQAALKRKWVLPTACSVVSFGAGVAVGYFLTRRQYNRIETEIEIVEQMTLDFDTKVEDFTQTLEAAKVERRSTYVILEENLQPPKLEIPESINVFQEVDPNWNYEAELSSREGKSVYVIHRDEFFGDEMGWDSQSTLTWYEQDKVLTEEHDSVLPNPVQFIGDCMNLFGHGSGDPNVVYIRNEYFETEYELLRNPSSYEIEVLGGQIEDRMNEEDLKHSRAPGKFRGD